MLRSSVVRGARESQVRTDEPAGFLRSLRHGLVQERQLAGALSWGALRGAILVFAQDGIKNLVRSAHIK